MGIGSTSKSKVEILVVITTWLVLISLLITGIVILVFASIQAKKHPDWPRFSCKVLSARHYCYHDHRHQQLCTAQVEYHRTNEQIVAQTKPFAYNSIYSNIEPGRTTVCYHNGDYSVISFTNDSDHYFASMMITVGSLFVGVTLIVSCFFCAMHLWGLVLKNKKLTERSVYDDDLQL